MQLPFLHKPVYIRFQNVVFPHILFILTVLLLPTYSFLKNLLYYTRLPKFDLFLLFAIHQILTAFQNEDAAHLYYLHSLLCYILSFPCSQLHLLLLHYTLHASPLQMEHFSLNVHNSSIFFRSKLLMPILHPPY